MEKRFILFVVLSVAILIGNILFQSWMRGKQPPPQPVAQQKEGEEAKDDAKKGDGKDAVVPAAKKDGEKDAFFHELGEPISGWRGVAPGRYLAEQTGGSAPVVQT